MDKENHLNKQHWKRKYSATFFLLNKANDSYSLEKIHGLYSTITNGRRGESFSAYRLRNSTWQAFQRTNGFHYNAGEKDIGSPFYIKAIYAHEEAEGFRLPSDHTEFMRQKSIVFPDHAVLWETDLITGALSKIPWGWGEGKKSFDDIEPLQTDPHDPLLADLKKNSRYQIFLNKPDKFWNAGASPKFAYANDFYPHKSFSCKPSENLFQEKVILNCSEL